MAQALTITSATRLCALFGKPVSHSISPEMQNAAFRAAKLAVVYLAFPVDTERVADAVASVRALNVIGANITIPHKEAVMPHLDAVDSAARTIGAVNTIVNKNGTLAGYNTDVIGAMNALKKAGVQVKKRKTLVLGAGGAAKAIVFGLVKESARVTIANRTLARAEALAESIPSGAVSVIGLEDLGEIIDEVSLIINCTPLGMHVPRTKNKMPVSPDVLRRDMAVFDAVYNPLETPLLRAAKKAGAQTISGLDMLVEQGAASFRLWTGKAAPKDIMKKAALEALRLKK